MRTITINIPENCNPSNLGFATALVQKAHEYTSEDINVKADNGTWVDLKSIMGVITLNYSKADILEFQVMGEAENFTAYSLEKFTKKLLELYVAD